MSSPKCMLRVYLASIVLKPYFHFFNAPINKNKKLKRQQLWEGD